MFRSLLLPSSGRGCNGKVCYRRGLLNQSIRLIVKKAPFLYQSYKDTRSIELGCCVCVGWLVVYGTFFKDNNDVDNHQS
jgi:hypothetical protein